MDILTLYVDYLQGYEGKIVHSRRKNRRLSAETYYIYMINKDDLFPIGRTHGPHALQGEVTCSFTNTVFDDADAPFFVLEMDGILVPFYLEWYRFKTETTALVKFDGVDAERDARELAGKTIYLPTAYRELSEPEAVTLHDLIGFEVYDREAGPLGQVTAVEDSTLNVLFIIDGGRLMLPAHDAFVDRVDYAGRAIYMHLPEGLKDLQGN